MVRFSRWGLYLLVIVSMFVVLSTRQTFAMTFEQSNECYQQMGKKVETRMYLERAFSGMTGKTVTFNEEIELFTVVAYICSNYGKNVFFDKALEMIAFRARLRDSDVKYLRNNVNSLYNNYKGWIEEALTLSK